MESFEKFVERENYKIELKKERIAEKLEKKDFKEYYFKKKNLYNVEEIEKKYPHFVTKYSEKRQEELMKLYKKKIIKEFLVKCLLYVLGILLVSIAIIEFLSLGSYYLFSLFLIAFVFYFCFNSSVC